MATVDECRQALHDLAARLAANAEAQGKLDLNRTLACRLTDLGTAFHGRLVDGRLVDIADGDDPKAKIALVITSDDLIALVNGRLELPRVISSVRANPFDLLKLRKLL
ncbi:sterol-binding protein [Actinoplanes sp. NPDC049802]|uniref:sterol-binding protein n=1 Tax=Actinoplanes sp. NPDC049802 TaxID=3154742 RepID=UPI0033F3C46D